MLVNSLRVCPGGKISSVYSNKFGCICAGVSIASVYNTAWNNLSWLTLVCCIVFVYCVLFITFFAMFADEIDIVGGFNSDSDDYSRWKAWVAMATAAPTVAALVSLWTIPPTLMTSDTQPGDATLLTATPLYFLPPSLPPCPHLQWCSQPDFAVRWPDFFSWQICFGLHTYLHVLSWTGKSITGNVDDETWMELEDSQNKRKSKKKQKNLWPKRKKWKQRSFGVFVWAVVVLKKIKYIYIFYHYY